MLNSAIASVIARYLKQCTVPTDSPDAHRVERFYHVWCFMRVELEFGSLAAAFSRNGGTYARTVAWRLDGVGRSTDTSESVDGLMGSG